MRYYNRVVILGYDFRRYFFHFYSGDYGKPYDRHVDLKKTYRQEF